MHWKILYQLTILLVGCRGLLPIIVQIQCHFLPESLAMLMLGMHQEEEWVHLFPWEHIQMTSLVEEVTQIIIQVVTPRALEHPANNLHQKRKRREIVQSNHSRNWLDERIVNHPCLLHHLMIMIPSLVVALPPLLIHHHQPMTCQRHPMWGIRNKV